MRKLIQYLFLSFLLILTSCAKRPEPAKNILLSTSFKNFTMEDFYNYFPEKSFKNLKKHQKKDYIIEFCKRELFYKDALDKNYDRIPEIKNDLEIRRKEILFNLYYQKVVIDTIINDEKLKDLYEKMKKEINMRQIFIKIGGKNGRSKKEAYNLAMSIYNKLKNDADFQKLAKQYSDDKASAAYGGILPPKKWVRLPKSYRDIIYNMKEGEITEPIFYNNGYYIFQVIKVEFKKLIPFEEYKETLKQIYIMDNQSYVRNIRSKMINNIINTHKIKLNKNNIKVIANYYRTKLRELKNQKITPEKKVEILKTYPKNIVLAEWDSGKYRLKDLLSDYEYKTEALLYNVQIESNLAYLLRDIIIRNIVEKEAVKFGLDTTKTFLKTFESYSKNVILKKYKKEEIENKITINDNELLEYYNKHKDSLYINPTMVQTWSIVVPSRDDAKRIINMLRNGSDFDTLFNNYSKRFQKIKGYLGYINKNQYSVIGQIATRMKPNTIYPEPVSYRGDWAVIKVGNIIPEGPSPFEEVKGKVKIDLIRWKTKNTENQLYIKLKNKYSAKINWALAGL
ncbi:MAG: peptidylprolyl isomerase [Candidatus Marinimicrobia bacterium]|nr:peptidylprolyl isomerase [Candidatus Neomarinimicrobiota bacterium]